MPNVLIQRVATPALVTMDMQAMELLAMTSMNAMPVPVLLRPSAPTRKVPSPATATRAMLAMVGIVETLTSA